MKTEMLNVSEIDILKYAATKHNPSLLPIIDSIESIALTLEQREQLREVLADELVNNGLRNDDEPNERGLFLEGLIDRIGHIPIKG